MLEKTTMTKTAKNCNKTIKGGLMTFDNVVQRAFVWGKEKQSEFIYSLLYGFPVPLFFCKTTQDGKKTIFDVLDGQQRLTTTFNFCENNFALTKLKNGTLRYTDENGEEKVCDLIGKKFEDLPSVLQDRILDTNFQFVKFENISIEEERETFIRLNNGQPLSTKSKNNAYCVDIDNIVEIGQNHIDLFSEANYGLLSQKKFDNKEYVALIMKMWEMLFIPVKDVSFESKNFNALVRETVISAEERVELEEFLNYMYEVRVMSIDLSNEEDGALSDNAKKKFSKETHFISLVPFMNFARKHDILDADFCKFINHFYSTVETTSISEQYNNACQSGNAKNSNITARHNALKEEFEKFFGVKYEETERREIANTVEQLEPNTESTEPNTEDTEPNTESTEPNTESTEDFMNTPEPDNNKGEEVKKSKKTRKRK